VWGARMMASPLREALRVLVRAAFIGAAYFISAGVGVSLLAQPQSIASFWPASGLLVGALVISRMQSWPPILMAVLAATLVINLLMGKSLAVSLAFAFVNSLEGFIGAWLLLRCCGPRPTLTTVRDMLGLIVLAGLVSPALASTLATTVVVMEIGVSYFWQVWYAWWVADMLGVLVMAPLILSWSAVRASTFKAASVFRIAEAILLFAAMLLVAVFVFGAESQSTNMLVPLPYLTFPFLLWAAMRFGPLGASAASLVLALVAMWTTAQGFGPFAMVGASVGEHVLSTQAFLGVSILTALILAAALSEHQQTAEALQQQSTFVLLLQKVAIAANEALTVEDAMRTCLDQVCMHTGWPVGHVYFAAGDAAGSLVPSTIWALHDAERFKTFRQVTEKTVLAAGIGLPGRVLVSGKPVWIIDVSEDANFPRAHLAEDIGVRAGFGFPVLVGKEVVAVLEFFSPEAPEPDEALLDVMVHIGTQLGRVVERTRAQEALRASELRFRSVVESAGDGMILADSAGNIMTYNKSARAIFGYSEEEVLGRPLTLLMPERYREVHRQGVERFRTTGKAHVVGRTVELHGLKKDGSEFPLELSISTWTAAEGTFYSGIIRDITERKRTEEEIRRLNEELIQRVIELNANNKELEAFSYSISHNLRAPLRALAGFSGILLEEHLPQLSAEMQRYLQRIQDNAQSMGRMIDDLLTLMHISRQPVNLQTISPARLVEQALDELRSTQEGRRIDMTLGDLPACRADPAMLRQVFLNLLSNALKFTRRREVARIEIGYRETSIPREHVYFVKDNGVGFDMQYANKLFGVFEHLHPFQDYDGTGVGLAIVQRIIQRHGGRVWAKAAVDQGATFYFTVADDLANPTVLPRPISSPSL
jgi:PAS domain S-box-containing protein